MGLGLEKVELGSCIGFGTIDHKGVVSASMRILLSFLIKMLLPRLCLWGRKKRRLKISGF